MKLNKLIIVGLSGLLLTSVSSALPGGKDGKKAKKTFEEVDTDKDGKVSEAEFVANGKDAEKSKKRFAKKDKDGDGFLNKEEFAKGKKGKKGKGKKKDKGGE